MRITRTVGLSAALAVALSLAGCTGGPNVLKTPPSPGESALLAESENPGVPSLDAEVAAAKAAQKRETGLTAPRQVYGGDCANLYSVAEVSEVVGLPVTQVPRSEIFSDEGSAIELHGGIRCLWVDANRSASVYLVALPEKAVNYQARYGCDVPLESGDVACDVEFVGGWIHVSGLVSKHGGELSALQGQQDALFQLFTKHISVLNLALPPKPAKGAWTYPVDCATIVGKANLASVPGLGAGSTGWQSGGSDAYYPQAEVALWGGFGPGVCGVTGESAEVEFTALGGARYNEASITGAAGASPLVVAGLDSVFVTPTDDGRNRIDVFDGPNWLRFDVKFTKNAGPIATALVASLDATAAH